MFRWDPLAGPTWIHEIFVWDPHLVGPTHFGLWAHNSIVGFMIKNLCFLILQAKKILTTICKIMYSYFHV
jgi:hypothetical protein